MVEDNFAQINGMERIGSTYRGSYENGRMRGLEMYVCLDQCANEELGSLKNQTSELDGGMGCEKLCVGRLSCRKRSGHNPHVIDPATCKL